MYPLFMDGWMSDASHPLKIIKIPKQILLKTARRRIDMAWFFKVARGWAPYSKEQSELLEAGFQRFHAGQKEPVVLDQWRVDLEQMSLEWHGITAVPTIFHKRVMHHGAGVSLVRFDFRGHWVFLQSSHQKLGPQLTQISRMETTGSVPLFWHDWFLFTVPNASKCHVKGHCSAPIFIIDSSRLRGWDPQPACCSKIFWFFFPCRFHLISISLLVAFWIGIE